MQFQQAPIKSSIRLTQEQESLSEQERLEVFKNILKSHQLKKKQWKFNQTIAESSTSIQDQPPLFSKDSQKFVDVMDKAEVIYQKDGEVWNQLWKSINENSVYKKKSPSPLMVSRRNKAEGIFSHNRHYSQLVTQSKKDGIIIESGIPQFDYKSPAQNGVFSQKQSRAFTMSSTTRDLKGIFRPLTQAQQEKGILNNSSIEGKDAKQNLSQNLMNLTQRINTPSFRNNNNTQHQRRRPRHTSQEVQSIEKLAMNRSLNAFFSFYNAKITTNPISAVSRQRNKFHDTKQSFNITQSNNFQQAFREKISMKNQQILLLSSSHEVSAFDQTDKRTVEKASFKSPKDVFSSKKDKTHSIINLSISKTHPFTQTPSNQNSLKPMNHNLQQTEVTNKSALVSLHNNYELDQSKKKYVQEISSLIKEGEIAFQNKDKKNLSAQLNKVAYYALVVNEMQLAKRSYNLLGHVYLSWRLFKQAMEYFKKLRDCSHMDKDLETKMYAFKQIGYCYQQLKDYEKAIICFKKQLQIAWHMLNIDGEMSAYDNLAIQYFYIGDLVRSKYYNERMVRGKTEAIFSVVRKISEANADKKFRKMKGKFNDKNSHGGPMIRNSKSIGREFQELFSDIIKDYSLIHKLNEHQGDYSPQSKHISSTDKKDIVDPASKYLKPGTPISEISGRDLPSPTGIKGEKNMLLLPYYQEIDIDIVQQQEAEEQVDALEKLRNLQMKKSGGMEKDEKAKQDDLFSDDEDNTYKSQVIINPLCKKKQKTRGNPIAKYFQRQKMREEQEARIEEITKAKRGKGYMTEEERLRKSYDIKDILKRAQIKAQQRPRHRLHLNHLSQIRHIKHFKEIEDARIDQTCRELKAFEADVIYEGDKVYMPSNISPGVVTFHADTQTIKEAPLKLKYSNHHALASQHSESVKLTQLDQ